MTGQIHQSAVRPTAADPLLILAMDHRDSFARTMFGVTGTPTDAELASMRDAKSMIFAAARQVADAGLAGGQLGVLVDERLGADVARQARQAGFVLAMPVEVSGSDRLEFEYGDDFAAHVEEFAPDWVKVLLRFNPQDPAELAEVQVKTLRRLHDWVTRSGRRWLLELLVPPTRAQLAAFDDQAHYDRHARPELTAQVIATLAAAGVHPGIWKLEGYETAAGARLVLAAVHAADDPAGPPSPCVVLGRDAPQQQVDHWLSVAAPLPGYAGFAIGRSIWEQPLADHLAGRTDLASTEATIAAHYRHFIERYLHADPRTAAS
jgi:myo-inositol catabolism protein IolC